MRFTRLVLALVLGLPLAFLLLGLTLFREPVGHWLLSQTADDLPSADPTSQQSKTSPNEQVKLTAQARKNLRLVSKPLVPGEFWRTIEVPGVIVDRPGISDRGVVSPVVGVVSKVHGFPGQTVEPGAILFTIKLVSESLHTSQMELFKNTRDAQIAREQKDRLAKIKDVIQTVRILEIDNQLRRLEVVARAYRQDLQVRGLTLDQIDGIADGTFVSEVKVLAPARRVVSADAGVVTSDTPEEASTVEAQQETGRDDAARTAAGFRYEIQELKVELGQQVQAGQTLCLLADHTELMVEGRCFPSELGLIQRAARKGWKLTLETSEGAEMDWPSGERKLVIDHVANSVDAQTRTLAFYAFLSNERQGYVRDGSQKILWRFRPGQRVRFLIRAERFDNVFVLPAAAAVREGPETFVFRQNGDYFDRKPVRVAWMDRRHCVVANDGSIPPGVFVAQGGAWQLNRVLASQASERTPGFHVHADGSVHANK